MTDLSSSDKRVRATRIRQLAQGVDSQTARDLNDLATQLETQADEEDGFSSGGDSSGE